MNKDFTVSVYKNLLVSLLSAGYSFQTYHAFTEHPEEKVILLRHDVDARKEHSLQFAKIQHDMGIVGSYYFRMVPQSFDEEVIREIASMGHEIGYHYEGMDATGGDPDKAIKLFEKNLEKLRNVAEVKTICMHGSPRSPYDNKEVWKKYDYRKLGIIAEPNFDLDFSKVLYLTDTGRRWDGEVVSIRDKVQGAGEENSQSLHKRINESTNKPPEETEFRSQESEFDREQHSTFNFQHSTTSLSKKYSFHSTHDIINACKAGKLPDQIMMNFHPQRWTDNPLLWTQELVWQNVKNVVKRGLVRFRG